MDLILQVKKGMTMTEKIFARGSEKTQLIPGENVWVNVDILMTHDVCGPGSIGVFKKEFGDNAKVLHFSIFCLLVMRYMNLLSRVKLVLFSYESYT